MLNLNNLIHRTSTGEKRELLEVRTNGSSLQL